MLHNSGPYGPNDTPINMGVPVNMTQMSAPMNIAHNLNNLGKIAQQPPQTPSPQYNLPNYSTYGHSPLSLGSQMTPFQNYHPVGFQPNYLPQNTSIHDTSWQNSMLPMNLNAHSSHNPHMLGYPSTFDKRTPNPMVSTEYREENLSRKNMPINIPQVPMKYQNSDHHDNYGLYNANQDKFNRYFNQNVDLTRTQEKPLLDNTRRKSLENTVRLIENILINTTKNKDLQLQRDQEMIMSKIAETIESNSKEASKIAAQKPQGETPSCTESKLLEKNKNNDPKLNQIENECTNKEFDEEMHSESEQSLESEEEFSQLIEEPDEEELSSISEEDEVKSVIVTEPLDNVEVKIEIDTEPDPNIVVKVEQLCWTDTDYIHPFHRDLNGIPKEDITSTKIIDGDNSVAEATAVIKSGSDTNTAYECPHCNLFFNNPKRFLIHTKWHSFGLTNDKRMELAKEREMRRNQRKEAMVVARMNSKEVTDATTGKKVYQCKDCDKAFSSKGSLKNHRQRFHPTRIRECKICRKSVLGWMALRAHLATHTIDSGFQCADCPKKFKYAHSLAKHRDTHLEKTLECHQCPKKFGSNSQLKMHQKVHERAQRGATFRCSYCAKGFYEAYNLSVHERTHRNERPFLCEICNTSFGTNSSLKRHLKVSHNSSKPYECATCHRSFVTELIRDRHALRSHGDPDDFKFTCKQCTCRYMKLKDLQKHVYKAHPKGKRKKKDKSDSE